MPEIFAHLDSRLLAKCRLYKETDASRRCKEDDGTVRRQ